MPENQKPQGTKLHQTADDHQSMDHHSMDEYVNTQLDHAQDHSKHGPMRPQETESTSPVSHSGNVIHAEHGESDEHAGHGRAHADHTGHEQMFWRKFWVSLILSIPVIIYSMG
jgi:Cu2+-exporting ATPase